MLKAPTKWFKCQDAELAWYEMGSGPPLLLIHGWPMHSQTWRRLAPLLATKCRLVMVDLAGLGGSRFEGNTDMRFEAHAARVQAFVDAHVHGEFACLASDTGATVARHLATRLPRLTHLMLLNTEMPGHRPPWVRWFQALFALPIGGLSLSIMARQPFLVRSTLGFKGSFKDMCLLDEEFHQLFVAPLQKAGTYREGVMRYLRGIDWQTVDGLAALHSRLTCQVRLIWGQDDPTFPVEGARLMATQFSPPAQIIEIADAKLLVHEERPDEVARLVLEFLRKPL